LIIYFQDDPEHIFLHNHVKKGELSRMNKEDLAKSKFHGKENFNCAQAVLVAFQEETGMSDEELKEFSAAGGGRVEGGICGALYAAEKLLGSAECGELSRQFNEQSGSLKCREIRKLGQLPCKDCVGLAARFVGEHLPL
jgi:hypothetical protein